MKKTVCQWLILGLGFYLIIGLTRELLVLVKKSERTQKMEEEISKLEAKKQALKEKLEYVRSEEFVEKEAREKLDMAKEEEVVVVLPEKLEFKGQSLEASEEDLPNWQQWLKLFF